MITRIVKESQKNFASSVWGSVSQAPIDPILGINEGFKNCQDPRKCLFGTGAYRDENGKPFVLESVREAEYRLIGLDHESPGVDGIPSYREKSIKLAFGENVPLERIASCQSISGTGSIRLGFEFLS